MEQTCEWIRRASGGSVSVEHLQRRNAGPPLGGGLMEQTYGDASRLPLPGHVLRHATLTDNRVPTGWLPVRRGSVSGSPEPDIVRGVSRSRVRLSRLVWVGAGICDTNCPSDTLFLVGRVVFFVGLGTVAIADWKSAPVAQGSSTTLPTMAPRSA